jgi:lysophospholipase L1-like esterase
MKSGITLLVAVCSLFFFSFEQKDPGVKVKEIKVKAPFAMPAIKVPDFSKCKRLLITDFGAVAGDQEKTSAAIAKAIDQANKLGGGVVVIPQGEWLTGKIHLKSNVNLHLNKGAVLLFSDRPEDYLPAVHSSWEGMECYNYSPLIYAYQCKNIAITGEGEVKAKMDTWKVWFARPRAHMESIKRLYNLAWNRTPVKERQMVDDTSHLRPQFIQFNRSENILLEGITITNSPFWTIHPYLCKNVVIRKVNVYAHGHNNDGVDPEMSQNVLIEDCIFDQGDDAIAIKSGRNPEGWVLKAPSKNIVIRNLTVKNGHQLVAIGSELSGGIENVFVDSCRVVDGAKLNHLLFIKTNERMGGYVKNIHATHLQCGKIDLGVLGIETDVLYQWRDLVPTYERRLTPIKDIYLDGVVAKDVKFVSRILGQKELPIENVFLKNITTGTVQDKKHIHENVVKFAQSADSQEPPLNIFTLGDSNGTFPESWPKQLKLALPNAEVFNISKSGRTIGFVNNGDSSLNSLLVVDENLKKAAEHTGDRPFDFIVIDLGTNDAKAVFAARQKEVPANLDRLIQKIKSSPYATINQAKIIIISPTPYGEKAEATEKYAGGDQRVKKMSKAFKKVAKRNDCFFVNGYKTPGLDINTLAADGLHLDAVASKKLIEPVVKLITK